MTIDELFALWDERDMRYHALKVRRLTDAMAEAVRVWRLRETRQLGTEREVMLALARVHAWAP